MRKAAMTSIILLSFLVGSVGGSPVITCKMPFSIKSTGGSTTVNYASIPGPKEKNPFTFNYETNESNISYYTDGDSIVTLVCASPFYSGMQPLPGQKTSEYENACANKVSEINQEAQKIVQAVSRVKPQVAAMRSAYLSYMDTCLKNDKRLQAFTADTMNVMLNLAANELSVEAQLNSAQSGENVNPYFDSFNDYVQAAKSVELGSLYLQDVNTLLTYAVLARTALDSSSSSATKAANTKLDRDMTALDPLKDDLGKIAASIQKINYGLKQLETASYYFGLAADDYMQSTLPDLKAKVSSLSPNEYLTQDNIDLAQSYVSVFEKWRAGIREQLNSANQADLIKISYEEPSDGCWSSRAYAASADSNYDKAYKSVAVPAPAPADSPGYLAKGWSAVKTGFHGIQNTVGAVVDTLDATAKNAWLLPVGIYEGVAIKDIAKGWKENYGQVVTNFKNGVSGSSVYKDAGAYLDVPEDAAKSAVQYVLGKGTTGQVMGFVAKSTVGFFTGLGKGIYKLANPTSTAGDYATGAIDVIGSCIGGSKVICKGSQIPGLLKGLATETKLLAQKGVNALSKFSVKEEGRLLLNKLVDSTKSGFTNIKDVNKAVQVLEKEGEQLTQQIKSVFTDGVKTTLKSSGETVATSLESMFTTSFKSLGEAIKEVIGKTKMEYLDNLVGTFMDDNIKALTKNYIDNGVVSLADLSNTPQQQPAASGQQPAASGQQPTAPQAQGAAAQGTPLPSKLKLSGGQFISGSGESSLQGVSGISEFVNLVLKPTFEGTIINIDQSGNVSSSQTVPLSVQAEGQTATGTATVTINGKYNNGVITGAYNISGILNTPVGGKTIAFDLKNGGHFSSSSISLKPLSDSATVTFSGPVKSQALIGILYGIAQGIGKAFGGSDSGSSQPPPPPTADVISNSYTSEVQYRISTQ